MLDSIDIGSNSTLLLIADFDGNDFDIKSDKSTITALGRELDKRGEFHPDSMKAVSDTFSEYKEELKKFNLLFIT